ncbi:MAG: GntR family transcriptional regulator [Muribaculaceae bacterium]|nr:GntR family transcriptional regulator [Muribaculaceae bacterium]
MIEIGKYNTLKVVKLVDFGVYLDGGNNVEILLPARYISTPLNEGDSIEVFIYTDSEDRLIATTLHPMAQVGEFAFLTVKQSTGIGAFLEWGLAKDLLVPFSEQRIKMREGGNYLVYVYLDNNTKRIVASTKINKFIGNTLPNYKRGDSVNVLICEINNLGYKAIVDNQHYGLIYRNETYSNVRVGDSLTAYVKAVRPDGKIDLTLNDTSANRTSNLAQEILDWLQISGGQGLLNDKSSPEEIKDTFACSKKDFKKALGYLYKERKINFTDDGITLV